jgi:hypothetical protein
MEYMSQKKNSNEYSVNDAVVKDIANAIAGLDYGSVLIKVHNAKIVQVEITERKRFDELWQVEKGGGI